MKYPKPYLRNILTSIEAIEDYRPDAMNAFIEGHMVQDAILMRLQDIGENLIRIRDVLPQFWEDHAESSWIKTIGLRNIISHAYGDVDLSVIWALITEDLESFKTSIQRLL